MEHREIETILKTQTINNQYNIPHLRQVSEPPNSGSFFATNNKKPIFILSIYIHL